MDLNQVLLQILIQILGAAIPALGGLIGGPLGWLVGLALKYLSGMLITLAEQLARLRKVDELVGPQVAAAVASTAALAAAKTPTEKEKAFEDFKAAHRALTRIDVMR